MEEEQGNVAEEIRILIADRIAQEGIDLLRSQLPEARIADWPDLAYRAIYWDDAHHLDRPEYLKQAIRQAAFYKINAFVLKLEGHVQYRSATALGEP